MLMGLCSSGTVIKFIPLSYSGGLYGRYSTDYFLYPDTRLLGLTLTEAAPADFIGKWKVYISKYGLG